ncbi:15320_t:CDS:2, partial [Cetraspora pellucida]
SLYDYDNHGDNRRDEYRDEYRMTISIDPLTQKLGRSTTLKSYQK